MGRGSGEERRGRNKLGSRRKGEEREREDGGMGKG